MLGMDLIGQIRRAYFEQRRPIKEIVRILSISRSTVRKVIRGQETEFKYEREVQPAPKLGEWVEVLTEILETEAKLPRRERRSTQRLFEELRGRGYDGAHDSVHRFAKAWRDERARAPAQAFVPLSFAPGEAYQFDWSHETIRYQGLPLMIKAAPMKLSHSRMPFVRAYSAYRATIWMRGVLILIVARHLVASSLPVAQCRRFGSAPRCQDR
jgi:transposase